MHLNGSSACLFGKKYCIKCLKFIAQRHGFYDTNHIFYRQEMRVFQKMRNFACGENKGVPAATLRLGGLRLYPHDLMQFVLP